MLKKSIQDKLTAQSKLKSLETNEYLTDVLNENFGYVRDKFFKRETSDKVKLLNVGSWIFGCIAWTYAGYIGTPEGIDRGTTFTDFSNDLVTLWFCVMILEKENNKFKISYMPARSYVNINGVHTMVISYQDTDIRRMYILVQEYLPWKVISKLYEASVYWSLEELSPVSLDTIPETRGLQEITKTGVDVPTLFLVKKRDWSLVEKVKQIVYAIDRHYVMQHTQYIQNAESFVLFKNIRRPQMLLSDYDDGVKIDFSSIGRIINGDDDASIEFVNNTNELIETVISDNDNFIRRISAVTNIPVEFFGLESKEGAVGLWSRTLRHWSFMKTIEEYRGLFDKALEKIKDLMSEDQYSRPDVFPKSDQELADELVAARSEKLISHLKAIQKYNKYTEEEAQVELGRINEEILAATPDNGDTIPQTPGGKNNAK